MTNFEAGTRVRVTPEYVYDGGSSDGSIEAMVGKEGVVQHYISPSGEFFEVVFEGDEFPYLFLPEELEAV